MSTPACPGCKAKFSHDNGNLCCKVCGLPDELADNPELVRAWQRGIARQQRPERKAAKQQPAARVNHKHQYRVLSRQKRREHAA